MDTEAGFLQAIRERPDDAVHRLVYADWLDERDDRRGEFLRVHLALRGLPPDHPHRPGGEQELSVLRKGLDPRWLAVVEPERAHLYADPPTIPYCGCFEGIGPERHPEEVFFHTEPQ